MILAHQIQLKPNAQQSEYFAKAAGTARFVYNWGLNRWQEFYAAGENPSAYRLKEEFNAIKREQFPWALDVTKCAAEQSFNDLGTAFSRFLKNLAGYPTWHKKGVKDSFYLSNDKFKLDGKKIRIPKLGWVKLTEHLRFTGKIMSATVRRIADRWFIAISVKIDAQDMLIPHKSHVEIGIDLGLKTLSTLSDGNEFQAPKPLKRLERKLKRLQRRLSRKEKGSNNRYKARIQLARLYRKISNIRQDCLHKLTTFIAQNYEHVGMEDLNTSGMLKNHKLAKAISDVGFHEFKRQMTYKKLLYGGTLTLADRFYPSSKQCSICGHLKTDLTLADRIYQCKNCGLEMCRDLNAAVNLKPSTLGSRESNACGQNDRCIVAIATV